MDSQFVANILIFQVILQELQYLILDNGVVQWLDFRSIVGSDWINLIPWICKGDKFIVSTLQGTLKGRGFESGLGQKNLFYVQIDPKIRF